MDAPCSSRQQIDGNSSHAPLLRREIRILIRNIDEFGAKIVSSRRRANHHVDQHQTRGYLSPDTARQHEVPCQATRFGIMASAEGR